MSYNVSIVNDECKNDLFINFFNRLIALYNNKDYNKLQNILITDDDTRIYKYNSETNDHENVINIRIWIDEETKKRIDILYYVCNEKDTIISLNNRIIKSWLHTMNNNLINFSFKKEIVNCNKDYRITLKTEKDLWNDFTKHCKRLDITVAEGIKLCVNKFIEHKVEQYL